MYGCKVHYGTINSYQCQASHESQLTPAADVQTNAVQ